MEHIGIRPSGVDGQTILSASSQATTLPSSSSTSSNAPLQIGPGGSSTILPSEASSSTPRRQLTPPEELLAIVVEQKLLGHSARASSGNSNEQQSKSSLDTLDLCHRRLQDIPSELVDVIKDDVVRLALAYNSIHTLPSNFGGLEKVRYLNIRCNDFTVFPAMLAEMASLEILDISKNKISSLPSEAGHLNNLRVLCFSHNRLRRLPTWVPAMRKLRILKIDNNPLQWPPPHVTIYNSTSSRHDRNTNQQDAAERKKADEREMRAFVSRLKQWMEDNMAKELERTATTNAGLVNGDLERQHHRGQSSLADSSASFSGTRSGSQDSAAADSSPMGQRQRSHQTVHSQSANSFSVSQEDLAGGDVDADVSMSSSTSLTSPSRDSPERSFKMRPLVLPRSANTSLQGSESPVAASSSKFVLPPRESDDESLSQSSLRGDESSFDSDHSLPLQPLQVNGLLPHLVKSSSPTSGSTLAPHQISPSRSVTPTPSAMAERPVTPQPLSSQWLSEATTPMAPSFGRFNQSAENLETAADEVATPASSASLQALQTANRDVTTQQDQRVSHTFMNPRVAPIPLSSLGEAPAVGLPSPSRPSAHGRTSSHSYGQPMVATAAGVSSLPSARKKLMRSKKSLPDLRESSDSMYQRADAPPSVPDRVVMEFEQPPQLPPLSKASSPASASMSRAATSPPQLQGSFPASSKATGRSMTASPSANAAKQKSSASSRAHELPPPRPAPRLRAKRPAAMRQSAHFSDDETSTPRNSQSHSNQQVERDSYFKRLSTFSKTPRPSSQVNTARSAATIDGARGILFALSQIFSALKHFTMFATDERMTAQFDRVLDIAGTTMRALIESLDRVDSLALRGQVTPEAIKNVIIASRQSVEVFRKVVGVLQLQLKPLQSSADVRYTRTLTLMLYGAMVEVSNSWKQITGSTQPKKRMAGSSTAARPAAIVTNNGHLGPGALPSIAEGNSPESSRDAQPYHQQHSRMDGSPVSSRTSPLQQRPVGRRYAGPFDAEDARADGMMMMAGRDDAGIETPSSTPAKRRGQFRRAITDADMDSQAMGGVDGSGVTASGSYYYHSASQVPASQYPQFNGPLNGFGDPHQRQRSDEVHVGYAAHGLQQQSSSVGQDTMIDHHLLSLTQQVTSIASGVWVSLLEHLASLGVRPPSSVPSIISPSSTPLLAGHRVVGPNSNKKKLPGQPNDADLSASKTNGSAQPRPNSLRPNANGAEETSRSISPSLSSAHHPHPQSLRKLNELREHCLSAAELTRRLQHTCEKICDDLESSTGSHHGHYHQDSSSSNHLPSTRTGMTPPSTTVNGGSSLPALLTDLIPPSDRRRLLDESITFCRLVTCLLLQIKNLSYNTGGGNARRGDPRGPSDPAESASASGFSGRSNINGGGSLIEGFIGTGTSGDLRRGLGALSQGCVELGVHLSFCAPMLASTSSASSSTAVSTPGVNGGNAEMRTAPFRGGNGAIRGAGMMMER